MVVALGPGKFYGSSLPRPRFYDNPNGERVDPPVPVLDPLLSWAEEAHWSMGGLSFKRIRLQGRIEGNIKKLRAEKEKIEKKAKRNVSPSPSPSPSSSLCAPVPMNLKRKMQLGDESERGKMEKKMPKKGLSSSLFNVSPSPSPSPAAAPRDESEGGKMEKKTKKTRKGLSSSSLSPPAAATVPLNLKRKMRLVDDDESDDENGEMGVVGRGEKRGPVRKLDDDFDRVAEESGRTTKSGRNREAVEKLKTKGRKLKKAVKSSENKVSGSVTMNVVRSSPRLMKRGSR